MMRGTTAPQVVAALSTLWTPLVRPVQTFVGPPAGDIPDSYLAICYGGDDRPGIIGFAKPYEGGNYTDARAEEFSVWCTASTATGDQSGQSRMDATNAILGKCVDAIQGDRSLGGVVPAPGFVDMDNFEWTIEEDGTIATVFFTVKVWQERFV